MTSSTRLVRFEQAPNDAEMFNTIFRVAHTIMGTSGFFDLPRLAKLAHAAEALMGHYRDGPPVSAEGITIILVSSNGSRKFWRSSGATARNRKAQTMISSRDLRL